MRTYPYANTSVVGLAGVGVHGMSEKCFHDRFICSNSAELVWCVLMVGRMDGNTSL